jgi:inhibitor of cysteine peptidase
MKIKMVNKDDKFILMNMDDAADIADVLKNKTSKKILDYLADRREASEKDISDGLGIAMNTVEYNLKKLVASGFVKKTGNFFWSVKGKKIPMYKLARKHIVISPGKKPSLDALKSILPVILIAAILIAFAGLSMFSEGNGVGDSDFELKQFKSQAELEKFLKDNVDQGGRNFYEGDLGTVRSALPQAVGTSESASDSGASDYSTTNIQVEGVDEADIVKNDGKYIYVVTGNKLVIIDSYPVDQMDILSEIEFEESHISQIYINGDKLIVFGTEYNQVNEEKGFSPEIDCYGGCGYYGNSESVVYIYDINDRENPILEDKFGNDGNYINSRMIGDYVYIVYNKYINLDNPDLPVYYENGVARETLVSDIYYPNYPDTSFVFTSIVSVNVNNGDVNNKVYLTGGSSHIYVSEKNIYLTHVKRIDNDHYSEEYAEKVAFVLLDDEGDSKVEGILEGGLSTRGDKLRKINNVINDYSATLSGSEKSDFDTRFMELVENFNVEISKQTEKTVVHKIGIDNGDINYKTAGEVSGHVLNQFSMDEYKGNFRIATTTGNMWEGNSFNHLYILDKNMELIGSVEDLAKGEKIYSARFIGDRSYIVTFKKVDPLFVIDLSSPSDPRVLGYLKIPGYSDYLHPYDENHVIGLGKEAVDSGEDLVSGRSMDFAWYQGVKISLFDVSDVTNPIEKHKFVIGDRGTNSPALYEHKAFLFDYERNLLVLPIELYEIDESQYDGEEVPDTARGEFVWQGAYIFDLSLDGIELRGRVSHDDSNIDYNDYSYYWGNWNTAIKRTLYMDNVLYTISNSKIVASDLELVSSPGMFLKQIKELIINELDYPTHYWAE